MVNSMQSLLLSSDFELTALYTLKESNLTMILCVPIHQPKHCSVFHFHIQQAVLFIELK